MFRLRLTIVHLPLNESAIWFQLVNLINCWCVCGWNMTCRWWKITPKLQFGSVHRCTPLQNWFKSLDWKYVDITFLVPNLHSRKGYSNSAFWNMTLLETYAFPSVLIRCILLWFTFSSCQLIDAKYSFNILSCLPIIKPYKSMWKYYLKTNTERNFTWCHKNNTSWWANEMKSLLRSISRILQSSWSNSWPERYTIGP